MTDPGCIIPSALSSFRPATRLYLLKRIDRSLIPPQAVQKSNSVSSLGIREETEGDRFTVPESASALPGIVDFEDAGMDVDDEEYGKVIKRPGGSRLTELKTDGRPRKSSITSRRYHLFCPQTLQPIG
jgi:hypothetical protein